MDWKSKCTKNTLSMKSSMIRELVELTQNVPGMISFAGGFPSPKTFPKEELADIFYETIKDDNSNILQYGSTGGEEDLKDEIIKFEKLRIDNDEIQICNGATNGIYHLTRTFIEPGDLIISESPSFLGSLVAFEAAGAKILPVEMQPDGLDIEQLQEVIKSNDRRRIKMIYTIPDFQNPTGITMSTEKRKRLIEIAIENNIIIIEDDPYSKLRFAGTSEKSLLEIAREDFNSKSAVVSIRSFSKLLGPGLRIGYVIADKDIIAYLNSWAQKVNVTTNRVSQKVVATYLGRGLLPEQLERIKSTYAPLCEQMINTLKDRVENQVKWVEPQGGMFFWLQFPEGVNTDEMFNKAVKQKVAFIPGSKFYPTGAEKYNGLRLNFSYPTVEQIEEGIERLATVFKEEI